MNSRVGSLSTAKSTARTRINNLGPRICGRRQTFLGKSANKKFSSKTIRNIIEPPMDDCRKLQWERIWKFSGPTRPSMTVWVARHFRMPTAESLWLKGVCPYQVCPRCGQDATSSLYLLGDCAECGNYDNLFWTLLWIKDLGVWYNPTLDRLELTEEDRRKIAIPQLGIYIQAIVSWYMWMAHRWLNHCPSSNFLSPHIFVQQSMHIVVLLLLIHAR